MADNANAGLDTSDIDLDALPDLAEQDSGGHGMVLLRTSPAKRPSIRYA